METSLLATKVRIPPERGRLVPRPRLVDRLQDSWVRSLTLVSAPAGFGKTTLVGDWIRRDEPVAGRAWVSLDEGDDDPVRFWEYLITALRASQPGIGAASLSLLRSPQTASARVVLTPLLNELSEIERPLVLVLDDYQFIRLDEIHQGLTFLLEHLPPLVHVVIVTRADPPLPLSRFRGRGFLLDIRAEDLRFNTDEAALLLRDLGDAGLTLEQVNALQVRTEGWAVGLKMAALSMGHHEDIGRFVSTFAGSQRYVADYLLDEVLHQQDRTVHSFLLDTSVLDRLTAPLCDAVAGRNDSQAMLAHLERSNLFLVPLDDSREWYRYEHLFADLLRHQLKRQSGDQAVAELHRRAGDWYERHGFLYDSISHFLAASDWKGAVRLIAEAAEREKRTGEAVTMLGWLRALPPEVLRGNPDLYLVYARCLVSTRQLDAADAVLKELEAAAAEDPVLLGRVTAWQAMAAIWRGDRARGVSLSQAALPLLSSADGDLRAGLAAMLGMMQWYAGHLREAEPLLGRAYEDAQQVGNPWTAAATLGFLSSISRWRGSLRRGAELCEQAIKIGADSPAAAQPHGFLGEILYEMNDLDSATYHLEKALELNRLTGNAEVDEAARHHLMLVKLAQGDDEAALELMKKLDERAATDHSPIIRSRNAGYHLDMALALRDLSDVSRWGEQFAQYGDVAPFYLRHLTARFLIAEGKKERVHNQLRGFYDSVRCGWLAPDWQGWSIRARLYLALSASDADEAVSPLAEALVIGEREGWKRTFVDEGAKLVPLLRRTASRGIAPDYVTGLLTLIDSEERTRSKGARSLPVYGLLSERELEVLRLLAAGLSNQQIAQRLYISPGTAKAHVHNILEKLNVQRRTAAVARARDLHLI